MSSIDGEKVQIFKTFQFNQLLKNHIFSSGVVYHAPTLKETEGTMKGAQILDFNGGILVQKSS
jgi:hypothetical protein